MHDLPINPRRFASKTLPDSTLGDGFINGAFEMQLADLA
jgi:hypothetical protein